MEVHGSPSLFSAEENQEEAEIWAKFMAMGQANGLEWARKMVAAQGAQQQLENTGVTNTNEVQSSDSGLCLLRRESVVAPAKRKQPARAMVGNKLKGAKKDAADSNLAEGPAASQKDRGTRRTKTDILEQEVAGASGEHRLAGASRHGGDHASRAVANWTARNEPVLRPRPRSMGCRWNWGADITVPTKEVEKHKWKSKVKPEESIENWLEAFAMLSTVIMEKFPEQGPALCKYNRVIRGIYPQWGHRVAELRQGIQAKDGAGTRDGMGLPRN
ncbi:hypothetical protein NDU88_003588 [Pleurodeles waltl]|uniref:Uncharacterized protein n=1 Tax=Pleurodeles waltl TaxID=8319 RepID=A0AAV7NII3_PLEWA|nr:hypothetical protein NDU88_003588 [Pleurodeles waltl]